MPFMPTTKSKVYRAEIAVKGPRDAKKDKKRWAKFRKDLKALVRKIGKGRIKERRPR